MARLPRLALAGEAHLVVQRGHPGQPVFRDDADRASYLQALRESAAAHAVNVHAYALGEAEVQLLLTPAEAAALGRVMQAVGRRYVSAYNRRHGSSGTLWEGRYRCGVVEAGSTLLAALRLVDGQPGPTSAAQRSGGERETWLADPAEYWHLGNTPFEREAAYRTLLVQPLPQALAERLREAALGGWAMGSEAFVRRVEEAAGRPGRPRARGRPRRT